MTTADRRHPRVRLRRRHIVAVAIGFAVAFVIAWPDRWVDVAILATFFLLGVAWAVVAGEGMFVPAREWDEMHNTLRAHGLCDCAGCIDQDGREIA